MDWLGAGIDGPLVAARAIHFAATSITAGTLIFRAVVAGAASGSATPVAILVSLRTLGIAWIGFGIAVLSGMIWLLPVATSMSGLSFKEAMTPDVLSTVIHETQFGTVWEVRLIMAAMMAGCLAYDRFRPARMLALALSVGLVAAIACTGHAGSTPGETATLHLAADALHLVAAAMWTGGLVALVVALSVTRNDRTDAAVSLARDATHSFSTMGIAVVVAVLATGIVNAWILVGSLQALINTGYGQLLMVKMALFAVMLLMAAANRFWLTPRLALPGSEPQLDALRRLTRNSMIEIALALTIFAIVGMLGTLHPAIHSL